MGDALEQPFVQAAGFFPSSAPRVNFEPSVLPAGGSRNRFFGEPSIPQPPEMKVMKRTMMHTTKICLQAALLLGLAGGAANAAQLRGTVATAEPAYDL